MIGVRGADQQAEHAFADALCVRLQSPQCARLRRRLIAERPDAAVAMTGTKTKRTPGNAKA